ncbi:MAG: hypothetical protein HPY57_13645 [Ignavibacteria bacterium]|nr:hypothetical protein [Ignavibacteria bacterium]
MKIMKLGEEIRKVKEEQVDSYLSNGWNYCSRSEWKTKIRDPELKLKKVEDKKSEQKENKNKGNPKGKAKKNKEKKK